MHDNCPSVNSLVLGNAHRVPTELLFRNKETNVGRSRIQTVRIVNKTDITMKTDATMKTDTSARTDPTVETVCKVAGSMSHRGLNKTQEWCFPLYLAVPQTP